MSLRKIYTILFFLGIFFIPFNEFEGLSFLGEYSDEASIYFFLSSFIILIIDTLFRGKIGIPYKNSLALLLITFLIWTVLSTFINYETVSTNYFKQTSGFNRYIRQSISLLIPSVILTILSWNVIKHYSVYKIFILLRKVILCSFIFVSIYGFIEIAIIFFGMGFLKPILESFDIFPFVNTNLHSIIRKGISSVTFEIPALATYLITVFPWMVSYIFTEKRIIRFIPLGVILILVFFSDSRSGLIVIFIQLICLLFLLILDSQFRKGTYKILKYGSVVVVIFLLINSESIIKTVDEKLDRLNFSKNLTENVSNKSRFGIQAATFQVFKDNPIVGVGLGQNTYHAMYHYPYWATYNNWEFRLKYKNQTERSFPPNFNFYTRTLAELGIVGFVLFVGLVFLCIYYSFLCWKFSNNKYRFIGAILLLSFIGIGINWMQLDYFKQYGFWLCLMLLIYVRLKWPSFSYDKNEEK